MYEEVCTHTLNRVPVRTMIWRVYSVEALWHITGTQLKPIQLYVEDDIADLIVMWIAEELGFIRFIQIGYFGAADTAFSMVAGLLLLDKILESIIAILDGDVYGSWKMGNKFRKARIKNAITGT